MTSVWVTSVFHHWDWDMHRLEVTYTLSNEQIVRIVISKELIESSSWPIAEVIKGFTGEVNKQLNIKIPETSDQHELFQAYLSDEFKLRIMQLSESPIGEDLFRDSLAFIKDRRPPVLRLVDIGDGMLIPEGFVEAILNDMSILPDV